MKFYFNTSQFFMGMEKYSTTYCLEVLPSVPSSQLAFTCIHFPQKLLQFPSSHHFALPHFHSFVLSSFFITWFFNFSFFPCVFPSYLVFSFLSIMPCVFPCHPSVPYLFLCVFRFFQTFFIVTFHPLFVVLLCFVLLIPFFLMSLFFSFIFPSFLCYCSFCIKQPLNLDVS